MFSSNDNNFGYCDSDDYNCSDDDYKSDSYDNTYMIIIMIMVVIISVVVFTLEKGSEKQIIKFFRRCKIARIRKSTLIEIAHILRNFSPIK